MFSLSGLSVFKVKGWRASGFRGVGFEGLGLGF